MRVAARLPRRPFLRAPARGCDMPDKGAPKDATGRPVPTVLTLTQTLSWVLWRRPHPAPHEELGTRLSRSEMILTLAKAHAEVEPYIRAGELPLRGKAVSYREGRY